jgi:hypothetical protein
VKPRYAILIDGGFITKKLSVRLDRHATADDVLAECDRIKALPELDGYELLRIYYYDAEPATDTLTKPVTKERLELSRSERFSAARSLFDQLVLKPQVALRLGQVNISPNKWRLKPNVARALLKESRALEDEDFLLDA